MPPNPGLRPGLQSHAPSGHQHRWNAMPLWGRDTVEILCSLGAGTARAGLRDLWAGPRPGPWAGGKCCAPSGLRGMGVGDAPKPRASPWAAIPCPFGASTPVERRAPLGKGYRGNFVLLGGGDSKGGIARPLGGATLGVMP